MKKLILPFITLLLLSTSYSTQAMASNPRATTHVPLESAEVNAMLSRLTEIRNMDKSALSRAEKKELRNEVGSTKEALRKNGSGVYLSGFAIVIIIILLIVLL